MLTACIKLFVYMPNHWSKGEYIARNNVPQKYSSFKRLRKIAYIIIRSDYPDMSSKRWMRYNVTFGRQLFIKVFNIYFSFARWINYYVCTWIYGPPYAVSLVKYLCGSTTWSNINILYISTYFFICKGTEACNHHTMITFN